jgi:hypothetical protein
MNQSSKNAEKHNRLLIHDLSYLLGCEVSVTLMTLSASQVFTKFQQPYSKQDVKQYFLAIITFLNSLWDKELLKK